jgi:hypothetical protein
MTYFEIQTVITVELKRRWWFPAAASLIHCVASRKVSVTLNITAIFKHQPLLYVALLHHELHNGGLADSSCTVQCTAAR